MNLSTQAPNKTLLTWLTALWLVGVAVFAFITIGQIHPAVAADSWPRRTATITTSQVITRTGGRRSRREVAEIRYQYQVNESNFSSSSISSIPFAASGNARVLVGRFPQDSSTEVAVNPLDPTEAYLQTGFRWSAACLLLSLLPLLCLGAAGVSVSVLRRVPKGAGYVGPYTAYNSPLPRLVTLLLTPSNIGWVCAALTGGLGMLALLMSGGFRPIWGGSSVIPPGINPGPGDLPWLIPATLVAVPLAGVCGFLWRQRQLAACQHEIVIDTARQLLITSKFWRTERTALSLAEIAGFCTRRVETRIGTEKQVSFEICPVNAEGIRQAKLLSTRSHAYADAVAAWLNSNIGTDSQTVVTLLLPAEP